MRAVDLMFIFGKMGNVFGIINHNSAYMYIFYIIELTLIHSLIGAQITQPVL